MRLIANLGIFQIDRFIIYMVFSFRMLEKETWCIFGRIIIL